MPFTRANFAMPWGLARSGLTPMLHMYRTPDAFTEVDTAGYFNEIASHLQLGDTIYTVQVDGNGVPIAAGFFIVRQITPTADVFNASALTLTNTD